MHPELGAIGPDVFIPIAEETGLIVQLTDFVLRTACGDLKQWQLSDPAYAGLTMNVNISGKDIAHSGLVARITRALVAARLEPQHLSHRADREHPDGPAEGRAAAAGGPAHPGRRLERGRLRHRLLVAGAPVQPARGQPEDRSLLHPQHALGVQGGGGGARGGHTSGTPCTSESWPKASRPRSSTSSCATWVARPDRATTCLAR